ncbi:glycosyltransferase family 4 protein [bacterium]|nr:glycosyltransferase family 4 protein [bacterium]
MQNRVAIYSGEIPSTTFIESLIRTVNPNFKVLLFGVKKQSFNYPENVEVHILPSAMLTKFLLSLWFRIKIRISTPEHFVKLNQLINFRATSFSGRVHLWAKYGAVVVNLPCIFHLQWGKSLSEWFFLKETFNVRIMLSLRGAHINYSPIADSSLAKEYKTYFPKVDAFHAVSNAIKKEALKYGADSAKIKVIYTTIDANKLSKRKTDYSIKNTVQILSVGRFHWKKGYHYSLLAISKLVEKGYKLRYDIVAGDPNEELLYMINDLKLNNYVKIHPKLKHNEVLDLMVNSDVFLLPSVEEGIANVVVESMAVGLPVISSNCGGMEEAIEDMKSGFIFNLREVKEIAEKLEYFITLSSNQRRTIAQEASGQFERLFSSSNYTNDMCNLYKSIL